MGYCCADCVYMDTSDENSYGEFWCGNHRKYYPGSDSPCSSFRARSSSSDDGCYITTAVCYSLDKSDDCYELNIFRSFRDNWLKHLPDGEKLIKNYYAIAPLIVSKINTLPNPREIYKNIWEKYLKNCLSLIESNKNQECLNLYKK